LNSNNKDKNKDNGPGDDLFKQAINDVRPIPQDKVSPYRTKKKAVPTKRIEDDQDVMDSLLSDHVSEEIESGEELLFQRPGIQNNVMRKLRKGQYSIEAQLDLHRMIVPEARESLVDFLVTSRKQGLRCVRVIHGKGLGSPGKLPVLKGMVNSWLKQRDDVLAFCSAPRQDGGTGAVYILLKKLPG